MYALIIKALEHDLTGQINLFRLNLAYNGGAKSPARSMRHKKLCVLIEE